MYRDKELEAPVVPPNLPAVVKHPCLPRWRGKVAAAKERGRFTERDNAEAASWSLCAIGEVREKYYVPFSLLRRPENAVFSIFGMRFMEAVKQHDFDDASLCLNMIEEELIRLYY